MTDHRYSKCTLESYSIHAKNLICSVPDSPPEHHAVKAQLHIYCPHSCPCCCLLFCACPASRSAGMHWSSHGSNSMTRHGKPSSSCCPATQPSAGAGSALHKWSGEQRAPKTLRGEQHHIHKGFKDYSGWFVDGLKCFMMVAACEGACVVELQLPAKGAAALCTHLAESVWAHICMEW